MKKLAIAAILVAFTGASGAVAQQAGGGAAASGGGAGAGTGLGTGLGLGAGVGTGLGVAGASVLIGAAVVQNGQDSGNTTATATSTN